MNNRQNLTDTEKTQLVNDFGKFKVTSITPVIVNPETTFIILNTTFQYDSNVTTKTQSDLETLIKSSGPFTLKQALSSEYGRKKLKRGRNTTRHVELFSIGNGSLVADTPGFNRPDIFSDPLNFAFFFTTKSHFF